MYMLVHFGGRAPYLNAFHKLKIMVPRIYCKGLPTIAYENWAFFKVIGLSGAQFRIYSLSSANLKL